MRRSSNFEGLKELISRDWLMTARVVVGALLLLNIIAGFFVWRPAGGSADELEARRSDLESSLSQQQRTIKQLRGLSAKTVLARQQGDAFVTQYFLDRRTAASDLVDEIVSTAKRVGISPREHSIVEEEVEGAPDVATRTVTGNYEGNYADLLQMVSAIDRSPRFLIIEALSAAPQQNGGLLFQVRYKAFVRDLSVPAVALQQAALVKNVTNQEAAR